MLLSAQIHLELKHDKTSCPLTFFSFCSLLLGDNFQGEAAGFTLMEKSWSGKRSKMTTVVQTIIILMTEAAVGSAPACPDHSGEILLLHQPREPNPTSPHRAGQGRHVF